MSIIEEYIINQPPHLKPIFKLLQNIILSSSPAIEQQLNYGIPFYYYFGWMCYLSPYKKNNGVYIAFIRGFELSDEQKLLEIKGRKQIKSITYQDMKDINEAILREIIQEALLLNEEHFKEKKNKIK